LGVAGLQWSGLMRRGEIPLIDLEPVRGSEADNQRPAVIISNGGANATAGRLGRGTITVVPITSNTARVDPFQTFGPARSSGLKHARVSTRGRAREGEHARAGFCNSLVGVGSGPCTIVSPTRP